MTDLAEPLVAGLVAGYGVAAADLLYAALAAVAGTVIAELLEPFQRSLQLVAAAVLVGVAALGFWNLTRSPAPDRATAPPSGRGTLLRFLALTSVNPATVAYFAALTAGLPGVAPAPAEAKAVFVLAAGAASLSWQLVLGAAGATMHQKLPPAARLWTGVAGNALVLALAARMALTA